MGVNIMFEMASIILSVTALLLSLITTLINYSKKRTHKNYKLSFETATQKYYLALRDLHSQLAKSDFCHVDLLAPMNSIRDILESVYPSAYFRIYVKAIRLSTDSNESFVESIASLTDTCETIELKPMRIKDNSAYEALLHKGASFFFVSDSDAYSRLFDYRNSDATFRKEWTSSLVFPIKKPHSSSEKHIIGFLCITSKNRLNNPQKNEKIMKLFPHIAEDLYEAVQYLEAKNTEGKG